MSMKRIETIREVFEHHPNTYLLGRRIRAEIMDKYKSEIKALELRQLIRLLRIGGMSIIASPRRGYKYTRDIDEINHYVNARLGEIEAEERALKNMMYGK